MPIRSIGYSHLVFSLETRQILTPTKARQDLLKRFLDIINDPNANDAVIREEATQKITDTKKALAKSIEQLSKSEEQGRIARSSSANNSWKARIALGKFKKAYEVLRIREAAAVHESLTSDPSLLIPGDDSYYKSKHVVGMDDPYNADNYYDRHPLYLPWGLQLGPARSEVQMTRYTAWGAKDKAEGSEKCLQRIEAPLKVKTVKNEKLKGKLRQMKEDLKSRGQGKVANNTD